MKYYQFDYADATEKETGYVYPQISNDSPVFSKKTDNSIMNLEHDSFPKFIPNIDYYELDKAAKLTDVLTGGIPVGASGGIIEGFVISEKLKEIFEKYNLIPCKYYSTAIKEGNNFHRSYYLMHIVSDMSHYIDFEKTEFFIKEFTDNIGPITVLSEEEYEKKNKQLDGVKIISTKKPVLIAKRIAAYDLFYEKYFKFKIYVSERLKNELLERKITGISLKEANDIEVD